MRSATSFMPRGAHKWIIYRKEPVQGSEELLPIKVLSNEVLSHVGPVGRSGERCDA
jgi:hypothetical protein